ncbi:YcaO-like family protein [Desulfovibrio sp. OttesenSCG-928-G11]|nr:YcaO-like family protein [Desulfovibrio sp. OttesenSCG-928-G11]
MPPEVIHYRYTHSSTEAGTGYFACLPEPLPDLDRALALIAKRPLDDFLRRHILSLAGTIEAAVLAAALSKALTAALERDQQGAAALTALVRELLLLSPALGAQPFFASKKQKGAADNQDDAADHHENAAPATPLILLRRQALPDHEAHRRWGEFFRANQRRHRALKALPPPDLPRLYPAEGQALSGPGTSPAFSAPFTAHLTALHAEHAARPIKDAPPAPGAEETAALAEERLTALGIIAGPEMRHNASLSPVALLRPWNLRLCATSGRQPLTLTGRGTTYGRGLNLARARVSCLMEMVERASCHVSVDANGLTDRAGPRPLVRGSRRELQESFGPALDPDDFPLEVPYGGQPLHWIKAQRADGSELWVPLQMAALFCNLDEISLMDAPGSTGIAAGASLEQAKVAALLEIFERDAEATSLFVKESCFGLEADPEDDPILAALLADYAARGINVHFQDLTGPAGVPVCKCFVMSPKGAVAQGYGASLNWAGALLSALTETPFPYPDGGPSGPMLRALPLRKTRDLPNYSLGSHQADLALLEDLLTRNRRPPIYVDMTRQGLDFPVLRALVPGFELCGDRDSLARVPLRLYRAWEKLCQEQR